MRYALNLADDGRILSVTFEQYAAPGQPIVDTLPDGDINDWLFVNGEYVYDPLPVPVSGIRANAKFTPGEYFTINGIIYQSTTTIPAGDAVIPGTNCAEISMADALNALKKERTSL